MVVWWSGVVHGCVLKWWNAYGCVLKWCCAWLCVKVVECCSAWLCVKVVECCSAWLCVKVVEWCSGKPWSGEVVCVESVLELCSVMSAWVSRMY